VAGFEVVEIDDGLPATLTDVWHLGLTVLIFRSEQLATLVFKVFTNFFVAQPSHSGTPPTYSSYSNRPSRHDGWDRVSVSSPTDCQYHLHLDDVGVLAQLHLRAGPHTNHISHTSILSNPPEKGTSSNECDTQATLYKGLLV
jgi:hypothetical protein